MHEEENPIELTFGEYLRQLRQARRTTLRSFAQTLNWDPSNYSRLETGKLPPPATPAKLEPFRLSLNLEPDSFEWRELVRRASISRYEIPPKVLSDQELLGKLPALFRRLEGDPIDEKTLDEIIAMLRREY